MKILVLSDSHAAMGFMRRCISVLKPDAVIHLGDYFDDAQALQEELSHLPFHMVAGNCDRYRCPPSAREMLCYPVGGVLMMMTHGHNYHVKTGLGALLAEARRLSALAVLFGHTHAEVCFQEEDGLWVINPGTSGYGSKTAAIVETDGEKITACRIVTQADVEEWK